MSLVCGAADAGASGSTDRLAASRSAAPLSASSVHSEARAGSGDAAGARKAAERAAALAAQDAAAQARHRPLSAPQRSTFEAEVTGLRTEL